MRPGASATPSATWTAGSGPARERIAGRTLGPLAGTWRTTTTGAAKSAGSARTSALSASTPPAEAPTTTTSQPLSGTSSSLPGRLLVNPTSLPRALGRAEAAVRPDRERGAEPEGDRGRLQHVLGRADEEAAAAGEQERDRVHDGDGVDPAAEQAERHVYGREEQQHEDGRLHDRPRLRRPEPHRDAARPQHPCDVDEDREPVHAGEVDAVAADLHPDGERHDRQDERDEQPPRKRRDRVPRDDPAPVRRRHEQAAREPALEVARDPEPGEDAAERGRLQQHEHELESRVPARVVEAGNVAEPREPARECREVEQREEHRRQQERRVLREDHDLAPREPESDVHPRPHVRAILTRRARAESVIARTRSAVVSPTPSASACPFQPSITSERSPSIM